MKKSNIAIIVFAVVVVLGIFVMIDSVSSQPDDGSAIEVSNLNFDLAKANRVDSTSNGPGSSKFLFYNFSCDVSLNKDFFDMEIYIKLYDEDGNMVSEDVDKTPLADDKAVWESFMANMDDNITKGSSFKVENVFLYYEGHPQEANVCIMGRENVTGEAIVLYNETVPIHDD